MDAVMSRDDQRRDIAVGARQLHRPGIDVEASIFTESGSHAAPRVAVPIMTQMAGALRFGEYLDTD
jgi:hypothetical protein